MIQQVQTSNPLSSTNERPKSNQRLSKQNIAIDAKKSVITNSSNLSQIETTSTPQKYNGSFQFPSGARNPISTSSNSNSIPSQPFSTNFTPKQQILGTSSILGGSIGSGLTTIQREEQQRQSLNFDRQKLASSQIGTIPTPDRKKNLPSLKGPKA